MADQHGNVSLLSNPRDEVLILFESRGPICPVGSHILEAFTLDLKTRINLNVGIFPTALIYMDILEKCQNNNSIYGSYSC